MRGSEVGAQAEVAEFVRAFEERNDVLRLDVPVDDLLGVDVFQPIEALLDDGGSLLFASFQPLHQVPVWSILHQHENVILVLEVGVEFDDVGMAELVLDFQLFGQLQLHVVLSDCRLYHLFQSHQPASFLVDDQVHVSELPSPDARAKLKILNFK